MEDKIQKESVINELLWEHALTYKEYRELITRLLAVQKTTGDNHSEKMLEYTELNVQRMNKWDKITKITPELESAIKKIHSKQKWLVITEAWCGDAAQNIPILNKITELNDLIDLRLILRDENLDVMDAYLTDGGRSIPKLVIMDNDLNELGQWGPRPKPVQDILREMKSGKLTYDEFAIQAHTWYGKDRTSTLQREMLDLLQRLQ